MKGGSVYPWFGWFAFMVRIAVRVFAPRPVSVFLRAIAGPSLCCTVFAPAPAQGPPSPLFFEWPAPFGLTALLVEVFLCCVDSPED
jgi:hypothetical protein